ncbi:MgtC/SapB family protein [Microvirga rosea]|uniref:MgtC/SapB family protein n=1 Tax=Microvirga rosea TaxID=2715425 RepID=UPI001D0AB47E|nr:MgtC/SapB family protein [Microvirga rosea]MCB8821002.1 MgtC/SapB family protein [Microvirga rosea]
MDYLSPESMEIMLRLVVATLAGMMIGINRDLKNKPIGMRTLGLVALSAAMLVLSGSVYKGLIYDQDAVSRVVQGILTGLGFLGAGVILRDRSRMEVKGLTTAATVWVAAALGITAGLGAWILTATGCAIALVLLVLGKPLELSANRLFGGTSEEEPNS